VALARLSLLQSTLLLDNTASDDELKALLAAATTQFHQLCDRVLEQTTHTDERHTGDETHILYPKQWPLTTLSAVSIWDTTTETFVSESTTYFDVVDQYMLYYPKLGQESNTTYTCYPKTPNGIKLTYVAGYATTSWDTAAISDSFAVPKDIEYAVALLAALQWMEGSGSREARMGKKRVIFENQEIVIDRGPGGIWPYVETVISTYRRPNF